MNISSMSLNEYRVDEEISLKISSSKSEEMNISYDENTCMNQYSMEKKHEYGYDNLTRTVVKDISKKIVELIDEDEDLNITRGLSL